MSDERPTNRLAHETSPYLLQHQHNPVDWYPWGPEAFERARREGKLVLLSVGYSACHWCHVMERESFEDTAIAALMNELYVSIKVDREERPDVDHIYMQVVQAMTGQGGWPMTVFMTAEGVPLFGGTYFPPEDRGGMPGFPRVLHAVHDTWTRRKDDVEATGVDLLARLKQGETPGQAVDDLRPALLDEAFQALSDQFDERYGGLDRAPKFPQPMTWEHVLRYWARTGDERAAEMVKKTLTRMARGGMYDQLGGGFHRYSVDGRWLVPHFEKMLYDNAQLARLYTDAWLAFGDREYRRVAEQTLDYLARRMKDPSGGFYSSEDADSEGEEGKFFVWTPGEVRAVLGDGPELEVARAVWGLDGRPNFDGRYILNVPRPPTEVAAQLHLDDAALSAHLEAARAKLHAARGARVRPGRDDKVLAAWNGMACRAFAEASRAFERDDYAAVATANAEFLLTGMRRDDGRLLRTWKAGEARLLGYLEDYGHVIDGLLAVYAATFQRRWLDEAAALAHAMVDLFWDAGPDGFYDTGSDHEELVVRPRDTFDNASPCGSSVASDVLLRLALLLDEPPWAERAATTLRGSARLMARYPAGAGRFLSALDFHLGPVQEIAVAWPEDAAPDALLGTVFGRYRPRAVVAGAPAGADVEGLPLLQGKTPVDGRPAAYVCENYACQAPTTDAEALARQLGVGAVFSRRRSDRLDR